MLNFSFAQIIIANAFDTEDLHVIAEWLNSRQRNQPLSRNKFPMLNAEIEELEAAKAEWREYRKAR